MVGVVMQIIEQTHDEKVAMYMKLKKVKLIEMLIQCNEILDSQQVDITYTGNGYLSPKTTMSTRRV